MLKFTVLVNSKNIEERKVDLKLLGDNMKSDLNYHSTCNFCYIYMKHMAESTSMLSLYHPSTILLLSLFFRIVYKSRILKR